MTAMADTVAARVCGNCGASIRGVDLAGYVDFSVRLAAFGIRMVQLADCADAAGDDAAAQTLLHVLCDLAVAFPELNVGAAMLQRGLEPGGVS